MKTHHGRPRRVSAILIVLTGLGSPATIVKFDIRPVGFASHVFTRFAFIGVYLLVARILMCY